MSKFGEDLIASLKQAADYARGKKVPGMRITVVEVDVPDVKEIRKSLRMSQTRFADAFQIPLATVRNWEQGRRRPDAPAAAYLKAISRRPGEIMAAVSNGETSHLLKNPRDAVRLRKSAASLDRGRGVTRPPAKAGRARG